MGGDHHDEVDADEPKQRAQNNGVVKIGSMSATLPLIPGQAYLEDGMEFLDTKIPTIRGRPALRELVNNLKPGVTVSLVSLPLSISLAIASGATPVQGIVTACWAGLVSAFFGGSHYNVVGPTGALSGILSYFSVTYGPRIQPLLAVMAGILCLLVWLSSMDTYLVFIPSAVMHGFTMGVAFIISANQINFALGLPKLKRHPEFLANMYESVTNADKASIVAILFFAVALGALLSLSKRYGKIPWAVVLAFVGIIIGGAADAAKSTLIQTIKTQYGDLQLSLIMVSDIFVDGLDEGLDVWGDLLRGAISIAAVAVLETLISARIADRMTKTLFNQRQEVMAVGLANIASGLTGGLPATAALARTALNVKSGATSRAAGIVNGLSIIILSTALFSQFKFLPLPIVAAILCNTAYRMLEVEEIKLLAKSDPAMFAVAVVTALICIVEDPTMGIVYGTFLAMIRSLMAMLHGHAVLHIFKGVRCEAMHVFTLNDHASQLRKVQAMLKVAPDAEELKAAKALEAAEAAVAGTALAQATMTIKKAREKAKEQVVATMRTRLTTGEFRIDRGANPDGHFTAVADSDVDTHVPKVAQYSIAGYFTYISADSHLKRLRGLFLNPETKLDLDVVALCLEDCYYADPDAMDALGDLVNELVRAKKTVFMLGFHVGVRRMVDMQHWSHGLVTFPDYGALLMHIREVAAIQLEKAESDMNGATLSEYMAQRMAVAGGGSMLGSEAATAAPVLDHSSSAGMLTPGVTFSSASALPVSRDGTPIPEGPLSGMGPTSPAPLTHPVMSNGLASPAPTAYSASKGAGAGELNKAADDWPSTRRDEVAQEIGHTRGETLRMSQWRLRHGWRRRWSSTHRFQGGSSSRQERVSCSSFVPCSVSPQAHPVLQVLVLLVLTVVQMNASCVGSVMVCLGLHVAAVHCNGIRGTISTLAHVHARIPFPELDIPFTLTVAVPFIVAAQQHVHPRPISNVTIPKSIRQTSTLCRLTEVTLEVVG